MINLTGDRTRFFCNLKISSKLMLLITLPFLGMFYFSTQGIVSKYYIVRDMEAVEELVALSEKISLLIHETQKERGETGGFMTGEANKFTVRLPAQRKITDQRIIELNDFLKSFNKKKFNDTFYRKLSSAMNDLKQIKGTRGSIDILNISPSDARDYYTNMHRKFINVIAYTAATSSDTKISAAIIVYKNLLLSKEYAGIECALLTNVFAQDKLEEGMPQKINELAVNQNHYLNEFTEHSTKEQNQFYKQTIFGKDTEEVKRMRSVAFSGQRKAVLSLELSRYIGYGGLIHQFKNYLLRGDEAYFNGFNKNYQVATQLLNKIETLRNISDRDKKDVKTIRNVIDAYRVNLDKIVTKKKSGANLNEVDDHVRIRDDEAIASLKRLMKGGSFSVDPVYWFEISTARIDLLKKVEDWVSRDLLNLVAKKKIQVKKILIFNAISTLILVIIALILMAFMAGIIAKPIQKLTVYSQEILKGNWDVRVIGATSDDETGKLAKSFEKMIGYVQESRNNLVSANQQLMASEQQLKAGNQQLRASEQLLKAMNQQLADNEQQLKAANQQLKASNTEMSMFYDSAIGREKRMVNLKRAINQLNKELGRAAPYDLSLISEDDDTRSKDKT